MNFLNQNQAASYLAGLIDGEGCVSICRLKNGKSAGELRRCVIIGITDKELIDAAAEAYDLLGIKYNRREFQPRDPKRRYVWQISFSGRDGFVKFWKTVPLIHKAKKEKLQRIIDSFQAHRPECTAYKIEIDKRTPGCSRCADRHRYRKKKGLPFVEGITGRPSSK